MGLALPLLAQGTPESLRVGVSVLPLEEIVSEIAGDGVEVRSLQREGDSCSVFEPRPSGIAWLAKATLFFRTGAGYETAIIDKLENQFSDLKVVDLRKAIRPLPAPHHHHHVHGEHHHHGSTRNPDPEEGTQDPHFWLDPVILASVAEEVASELVRILPAQAEGIQRRKEAFQQRAREVHLQLTELLAPHEGKAFYIYHPALGYFARRYGLRQVAIAGSSDSPTIRELHARIREARSEGIGVVFVQPQESQRQADVLAEAIGATVVEVDPMATEWEANLLRIGKALENSFATP